MSGSSSNTVKLSSISFKSAGVYRCEVSNEFPDFDTISKAEILSVVGRHANKIWSFNLKVSPQQFPLGHSYPQHLSRYLLGTRSTSTAPSKAPSHFLTFSGTSTNPLSLPHTPMPQEVYWVQLQKFTSPISLMAEKIQPANSTSEWETNICG